MLTQDLFPQSFSSLYGLFLFAFLFHLAQHFNAEPHQHSNITTEEAPHQDPDGPIHQCHRRHFSMSVDQFHKVHAITQ